MLVFCTNAERCLSPTRIKKDEYLSVSRVVVSDAITAALCVDILPIRTTKRDRRRFCGLTDRHSELATRDYKALLIQDCGPVALAADQPAEESNYRNQKRDQNDLHHGQKLVHGAVVESREPVQVCDFGWLFGPGAFVTWPDCPQPGALTPLGSGCCCPFPSAPFGRNGVRVDFIDEPVYFTFVALRREEAWPGLDVTLWPISRCM